MGNVENNSSSFFKTMNWLDIFGFLLYKLVKACLGHKSRLFFTLLTFIIMICFKMKFDRELNALSEESYAHTKYKRWCYVK
jgi:hypothetical protein